MIAVMSAWNQKLSPYAVPNNKKALFQLITTVLLYVASWLIVFKSLEVSYVFTLFAALPAAGLLMRLFMFQHDCGHGSFFSSKRANIVVGSILGVATLMPFHFWRHAHALHHSRSSDLDHRGYGDIIILTCKEYKMRSSWGRFHYRLYRNPIVLLTLGPLYVFVLKQRLPLDTPLKWRADWRSVFWTNAALLGVLVVASLTIGLKAFFLVQIPLTLISGACGVWLFYVQHQFTDTYWSRRRDWSYVMAGIKGSSFLDLPRWLDWFTGSIGFHHIHHLARKIPNYRLRRCFKEVSELHQVTRLTLFDAVACMRLKLWDEETRKLVSFKSVRAVLT